MTLHAQHLMRTAAVAALLLAACGQKGPAEAPEAAPVAPAVAEAAAEPAAATRSDLPPETKLAFVHTANVVGELEPCG